MAALKVQFYVPDDDVIVDLPKESKDFWHWLLNYLGKRSDSVKWDGAYSWTIQTYLFLKAEGVSCELIDKFPDEGVVISHSDFLSKDIPVSPSRFVVEIKPDRALKYMWSNVIIVQNPKDPYHNVWPWNIFGTYFIPFWPQPCLKRRAGDRGDAFENIAYFGNPNMLDPSLHGLEQELGAMGLNWSVIQRNAWHDYSLIDAVVGIHPEFIDQNMKPASKLINAWAASVPAILAPQSAYLSLRQSDLDFLPATSKDEFLAQAYRLKTEPQLRKDMVANGLARSQDFSAKMMTKTWIDILRMGVLPKFLEWQKDESKRMSFIDHRLEFFAKRPLCRLYTPN